MKVYNYNLEGYLIGVSELDNSDKCQITGDWLIPAMATEKEPLVEKEGFKVKFNSTDWEYEKILTDEEKKVKGELSLEEGEIIQENQVIKIEKPSDFYDWDFTNSIWFLNVEREKQMKSQEELNEANKLIEFFELATKMGMV